MYNTHTYTEVRLGYRRPSPHIALGVPARAYVYNHVYMHIYNMYIHIEVYMMYIYTYTFIQNAPTHWGTNQSQSALSPCCSGRTRANTREYTYIYVYTHNTY